MLLVYISVFAFVFDLSPNASLVIGGVGVWAARLALFANIGISLYRTTVQVTVLLKLYAKTVKLHSTKTYGQKARPGNHHSTTF